MDSNYIILAYIILVIIIGNINKVNCLDSFTKGVKQGTVTVVNMFSYLVGFVVMVSLLENSGILLYIESLLDFNRYSPSLLIQAILRPFSSSSSYVIMLGVYSTEGVDSRSGILSTFIHTVSDASIYIIGFYFAAVGIKKYKHAIWIGLLVNIIGFILAWLIVEYLLF